MIAVALGLTVIVKFQEVGSRKLNEAKVPKQRSRKMSRSVSSEASISAKHAPQLTRLSLEVNNSDGETAGSRKVKEAKKVPRQRSRKKSVSPEAGISAKHAPQTRLSLKTSNSDGETAGSRKVKEAKCQDRGVEKSLYHQKLVFRPNTHLNLD